MSGKLFVLSASSGVGKTSLVNALVKDLNYLNISRVITYTTKVPRSSEVQGVDYHFISKEEFEFKIKQGYFIEWSNVYGAYYGSPKYIFDKLALGFSFFIILDKTGLINIKESCKDIITIWLMPPSFEELSKRLCGRGDNTQEDIKFRLEIAKKELETLSLESDFKYSLINDDFNETLNELKNIVLSEINPKVEV